MTSFLYVVSVAFHTSVSALRKCMDTSRKYFGWERGHSCTACCTSSSDLKVLPPIASLSGQKTWKSLGGKVWRVRPMWKTLEGQILDCWNSWTGSMGPSIVMLEQNTCTQTSTSFGLIAGCRWFFRRSAYVALVSVPPGHVVLLNYPSFIPKEGKRNLSRRWLCAEFFRFWWGGMAPFLARFLGFRLVVVDPGFISRNISSQKAITFLESHHLLLQSVSKFPGRHLHVVLSILQSAGMASTLQTFYGTAEYHGRYGVLIHDSYPDVRLFHWLLRGDFPSRWLQLLQWPRVSLLGAPDLLQN